MNQIYSKHLWGGNNFDFYSGGGSHNIEIINPYLTAVTNFLKSFKTPLTLCDLGCGDFNIGQHLTPYAKKYIGVDIVDDLISRNKELFQQDNLEFLCLDISEDSLPQADCIILRQVLQHLSNTEIQRILKKIQHYKFILLTEHIPVGNFSPNKDIISGQGIRLKHDSGLDILKPPFNFKVKEIKVLNEYLLENNKEYIVTKLFQVF
ncbi:class I SAM-dependent methyltransferase [Seonamhaeicola sp. MEBiC1930]|uniref:class I SAM-dependent methyltransferase n=1 Tax=Seonamhaeicola sp. MEBiC01930 TaxID=2976768 RepID=UPI003247B727